ATTATAKYAAAADHEHEHAAGSDEYLTADRHVEAASVAAAFRPRRAKARHSTVLPFANHESPRPSLARLAPSSSSTTTTPSLTTWCNKSNGSPARQCVSFATTRLIRPR